MDNQVMAKIQETMSLILMCMFFLLPIIWFLSELFDSKSNLIRDREECESLKEKVLKQLDIFGNWLEEIHLRFAITCIADSSTTANEVRVLIENSLIQCYQEIGELEKMDIRKELRYKFKETLEHSLKKKAYWAEEITEKIQKGSAVCFL